MKIIKENNISNVIILSSMFIITSLMLFNSYYFITKQYDILDRAIKESKETFIKTQKKLIKREVDSIIEIIKFKTSRFDSPQEETAYKKELKDWIRSIRFGKKKENYIFVYKIENFQGGKNFAKMLINSNRPDLENKYISDNYKDALGKEFRKIFLKDIKDKGDSFVKYMYKKLDSSEIRPKITYFKLYPEWNWIISAGTYLDEIDVEIAQKEASLNRTVQIEVTSAIIIFLFFSLIANAFAIFLGKQIEKFLNSYIAQVKQKTEELQELNKDLENRIHVEVQKSREQEQLLIQKSKFIALGEMISNIAHQWRQPLSKLSAIMMTIKFKHNLGKLDKNSMQEKSQEAEDIVEYMSKTIDDFREFFMPKREKKEFYAKEAVDAVINIIGVTAREKNITIDINISKNEKIYGHKNEFEQVILNIITNAKHILISEKIQNPKISINLKSDTTYSYLCIEDNAGGITVEPIEKIFEPYFTTKEDTGGTGIGLYMSKLIIEKSMGGVLVAENKNYGACFTIRWKRVD
ncbi:cache domain-containing protein [Sulfurospirillum arcachonense]|uniref:cache domain-containing protein n=1 Tax=Sulfurospirillum arcachonense TaxID=57666 RepID=UPI000469C430|nr:cache domain-containing protein [Sulfurospirillum arcachonense]